MRHGAGGDDGVMNRLVAVAVDYYQLPGLEQRHQHRLVGGGGSVRHITAKGAAENLRRHPLGLGKRRVRLGARKIAQRFDGYGKVAAEDRRAKRLVEAAQKRRRSESVAAVVPRGVPVGAGLDLHILPQRVPEARFPEGLEQMHQPFAVPFGIEKNFNWLLRPAPLRHDHRRMARIGHNHARNCWNIGLEPVLERKIPNSVAEEVVIDQEKTSVAACLAKPLRRIATDEEHVRQLLRPRYRHQLQRRILHRHAHVEGIVAKIAESVGKAVLHQRNRRIVVPKRFMQPQNSKRSHLMMREKEKRAGSVLLSHGRVPHYPRRWSP